ncbi:MULTISPECIES: hypothetical protein [unclassified Aureimonas]|uniref:hypothetical protein n=1 Tax=unclassified Aureimonas TaxID=2615206 RepID=UPI000720A63F|nr:MULTISPECIES: hypothetical protein [unclassified Aureimonas]ALN73953.1 hypothetical protein M673_14595 [Aureimonas sp. AU20]
MRRAFQTLAALLASLTLGGCLSSGAALTQASTPALPPGALSLRPSLPKSGNAPLSGRAEQGALAAQYQALQFGAVGQAVPWSADGYRGEVVPTQLYRIGSQDCRGYTHVVTRGSATTRQVGTACRSGVDTWTPVG